MFLINGHSSAALYRICDWFRGADIAESNTDHKIANLVKKIFKQLTTLPLGTGAIVLLSLAGAGVVAASGIAPFGVALLILGVIGGLSIAGLLVSSISSALIKYRLEITKSPLLKPLPFIGLTLGLLAGFILEQSFIGLSASTFCAILGIVGTMAIPTILGIILLICVGAVIAYRFSNPPDFETLKLQPRTLISESITSLLEKLSPVQVKTPPPFGYHPFS